MRTRSSTGTIFLKHDLKPDKVNINYIRPPSADPNELNFDHKRYGQLSQMILDDTKNAALKNNYGGKSGFFKAAVDIYMHDLIAKTKEENKAQLKCYAGSAGAVIYDNGALSSCENKADVLNLRDYDWNFQAAWKTDMMKARRKEAGAGCLLHARIELLLPEPAVQCGTSDQDQKAREADEKGREGNGLERGAGGIGG